MSSVKIRTTKVSKSALEAGSGLCGVKPAPNGGFLVPFDVNERDRIMVYLPEELTMKGPNELHIPLLLSPDMSGALTHQLGEQYSQSVVSMGVVKLLDADGPVMTSATLTEATHLLVHVKWPLNAVPTVSAERREALGAVFYARANNQTLSYGMDVWLLPMSVLDLDVMEDLAVEERVIQSSISQAWRIYELEKPYYRARMEELFAEVKTLPQIFQLGEDYVTIKGDTESPAEDRHRQLWYDEYGLNSLRRVAETLRGNDAFGALLRDLCDINAIIMGCGPQAGSSDGTEESESSDDAAGNPD